MNRHLRQCDGYLTVYVALTLGIILSLCLALIEGVRTNAIKLEAVCVCDIAGSSVLAEYHRQLWEQYNLFYVDTSYGTAYVSPQNTKNRMQYYLDKNVDYEEVEVIDVLYKDFLGLSFENLQINQIHMATDGEGAVFRRSAILAIKDDLGITQLESILEWIGEVTDSGYLEQDISEQKEGAYQAVEDYRDSARPKGGGASVVVDVANPVETAKEMQARGILSLCLEEGTVSGVQIEPSGYISARRNQPEIVCSGTYGEEEDLSVTDKLLLREYFLRYAGRYGQEKEGSLLKYQVEYVINGKSDDYSNLSEIAGRICAIREAVNVAHIYGSEEKMAVAKALGTALAAALLLPEAAEAFAVGVVLAWGFMESVHDVKVLLSGGRIPFIKTKESWHTDLESIWQGQINAEGNQQGQSYEDYLRLFLYLTDSTTATYRFMDLCEMDIRMTPGNERFRIDACANWMELSMDVVSRYGYRYEATRELYY